MVMIILSINNSNFNKIYYWIYNSLGNGKSINDPIVVNALSLYNSLEKPVYDKIAEYFNAENDLNIQLNITYVESPVTDDTDTIQKYYRSLLDTYFENKSKEYDLIFFNNIYSYRYESYLEDLKKWLPIEHLELYNESFPFKTCRHNNKWIALVSFYYYYYYYYYYCCCFCCCYYIFYCD